VEPQVAATAGVETIAAEYASLIEGEIGTIITDLTENQMVDVYAEMRRTLLGPGSPAFPPSRPSGRTRHQRIAGRPTSPGFSAVVLVAVRAPA
jgi:hypothetical protein